MNYPCPKCSNGIAVVEETAGKTVLCPRCGGTVKLPRMATSRLKLTADKSKKKVTEDSSKTFNATVEIAVASSRSGNEEDDIPMAEVLPVEEDEKSIEPLIDELGGGEEDDDIPTAIVEETAAKTAASLPPVAKASPARKQPLAKVVKERRKGVIIPKAVDSLVPDPRLKPGDAGSPGNFTLKEPTLKEAKELKVKPVLMSASQAEASREFRGFRGKIDDSPSERISPDDAAPLRVRPRSKIGQLFGRARDFILSDPKLRKGPAPEDARDTQLKDQYRLVEPTRKDASTVDVRPIAKRGDNEVSGFHDVMDRFVPLHEFEEMEGFGEMSREEQEAILRAQMEVEQTRVSSTNKRVFFSALVFAAPAMIAVTILSWHALKKDAVVVPVAEAPEKNDTEHKSPALRTYSIEDAKALAREIDQAASLEELAAYIRRPEVTLPRMRKFYERVAFRPNQLLEIQSSGTGEIDIPGNGFLWVMATDDQYSNKMLAFEKTRSGLRFDWESYVNYSDVPWTDFVDQQHARQSEFRVTLSKDNYYNYRFSDEEEYLCYRLTDPMNKRTCYGYTPRKSQAAGVLEGMLGILNVQAEEEGIPLERASVKVILKLRFPERTPDAGQAMINKVVCGGWVKP